MKVLFLSRWYPYPPGNGSKLRVYNLIRGMAAYHEITLLSFNDQTAREPDIDVLQSICREVKVVPYKPFDPQSQRSQLGFLSLKPRSVLDTFSFEMKECLEKTLNENEFDVVIASEIDMVVYSQYFCCLPALLDELQVQVFYDQYAQASSFWTRFRYHLTWIKLRYYLTFILSNFQVCISASTQERQLLSRAVPSYQSFEVIPNGVDLAGYQDVQEVPQPNTLIFTGSFSFRPNYEAMVWFIREVYPRIQAKIPDVHLTITGDHAKRPLPSTNNVTLTGFVDDIRPLIARSWLSVVPLHVGGGTRLKILEAMALGTPVVATSKGAEGIEVKPEEHILIADSPEDFANAIIRLLEDLALRQKLVENARQLVCEKYDWAVIMPRFLGLIEKAAHNSRH